MITIKNDKEKHQVYGISKSVIGKLSLMDTIFNFFKSDDNKDKDPYNQYNYKIPKYYVNDPNLTVNQFLNKYNIEKKAHYATFNNLKDSKLTFSKKPFKKQIILNILYYDESLLDKEENNDNCSFLQINTKGTFYGCHNFDLFKNVCEKIKKGGKEFILLSSGSSAEKIFNYCMNMKEIREFYIYCYLKEKYIPLLNKYSKLKGVYNNFSDLKEKLYSIKEIKSDIIKSSNLIYFEDYNRLYIKLHFEIIRKYKLFKILKASNYNETKFLEQVKIKFPNFLDIAKQFFPDKDEIINFFKENTNESESTILEVFNCKDDVQSYIHNYTLEGFYYRNLNKF